MKARTNRVTLIDCGSNDIQECIRKAADSLMSLNLYRGVDKEANTIILKSGTKVIFCNKDSELIPPDVDASESAVYTFEKFIEAFDAVKEDGNGN